MIGIDFAIHITPEEERVRNTFKEVWEARWTPECEIQLAENSLRGDTIPEVAVAVLFDKLATTDAVGEAAALARQAVDCDLAEGMALALRRVQALAVDDSDLPSIANALHHLSALVRYGDVTDIDLAPLQPLVAQLFLRAALLAHAAARCDDQAAKTVGQALEQVHIVAFRA